jgi:integrase
MTKKGRRGRGEGGIRKRKDGRWEGILDLGIVVDGRRKTKSVYGRTRAEAASRLREAQRKHEEGTLADDRMTVGKWLDHWVSSILPNRVANNTLARSTLDQYEDMVRLHLKPGLGHHRLTRLTPTHVDEFIAAKRACTYGKKGKHYSPDSLRLMRSILSKALSDAQGKGHVHRNVAELSEPVRGTKRAEKFLTLDEARTLVKAIADDRLHALWIVALTLGLRRGEVAALHWRDVDLDANEIRVGRKVRRVRRREFLDGPNPHDRKTIMDVSDPKTERSLATLKLPETAVDALRRHRVEQASERLAASVWLDDSLVFTTPIGTMLDPDNLWTAFSAVCVDARLGHRNPHQLRHSAATILLGQGIPLHEVTDIMRHSSISITKDTYRHRTPERMQAGADAMDAALRNTAS